MILRPSSAHQWMRCGMVAKTPPDRPEAQNDAALEGTCAAWVAEVVINGDATTAEDLLGRSHSNGWVVDEDMVRHMQSYLDIVQRHQNGRAEVFRSHPLGLQGTLDFEGISADGRITYITDLKYGYDVVEARENWQLLCYLWLLLTTLPAEKYPPMVQLAIYQPRALHRDGPYRKWVLGIDEYMPYMEQITRRIQNVENMAVSGDHCKHCLLAYGCEALLVFGLQDL